MRTRVAALLDNIPRTFERNMADGNIYREKEKRNGERVRDGKEWKKVKINYRVNYLYVRRSFEKQGRRENQQSAPGDKQKFKN